MKKLFTLTILVVLFLAATSFVSASNYDRGLTRRYTFGPGAAPGIIPPGYGLGFNSGFDYGDEEFLGFYDPVIFGGLGNSYYAGGLYATGFPFYANQPSLYIPRGNFYRYEADYGYGAGYGAGFSDSAYYGSACLTGCPGYGSPANRIYGVGY
ncbi:hypothetical protein HYS48_01675 [Candidatus Woesearchaeota archaeon]|nr:hypothetical protein [Candidatus Woesearchaeota archaeon]